MKFDATGHHDDENTKSDGIRLFFQTKSTVMKIFFFSIVCMLWMVACKNESPLGNREMAMDSKAAAPFTEESQPAGSAQASEGKTQSSEGSEDVEVTVPKIIRNGTINIAVRDAIKMKAEVDAIIAKHKAYAGNEQLDNTDYQANYHIQIRVPADQLDGLVADLEALDGTVIYKNITARDVSEEYIDLETRLTNKRAYVEQYRQLLKTARTIEEILKVREKIRVLEEEIESAAGRLRYLTNQVALSTIELTLIQKKDFVYKVDHKVNFLERFKDSIASGWYGFMDFFISIFVLWPVAIIVIIIWWLWKRSRKNKIPPVK
ncbi:MAG TPA: DUF4349 domain-containing protein [Saprospiraceae bacterium]|nr:DUF4349 domain-containing protein [Saprospiraceae bacterium]